jgi:hypothetical protein
MTDPTTLLALAERCEQAAGPDRELDARIECAVQGITFRKLLGPYAYRTSRGDIGLMNAKRYTAWIDAAVTLVPEGWGWAVSTTGAGLPCAYGHPPGNGLAVAWIDDTPAATPALAMCAFALRARAGMAQHSSET